LPLSHAACAAYGAGGDGLLAVMERSWKKFFLVLGGDPTPYKL
jgi:hypothetical protein